MVNRTRTLRCRWIRNLAFAAAIGCWMSFVNSTRADGPALVPPPAPPASLEVKLPTPELPTLEPVAEPVVESVEITVPTLGASGDLPVLKAPETQPLEKTQDTTQDKADLAESETEFVTIRSRKKPVETPNKNHESNLTSPLLRTAEPVLVPPTVGSEIGSVNDPYLPSEDGNGGLMPIETQYSVPLKSTPVQLERLIETMVLKAVPSRHTNDSEWGKKKTVTSGFNIGLRGLLLKTERQTREVNHGEWKKFQLDRKSNHPSYTVNVKKLRMETEKQVRFSADYLVPVTTQAQQIDFSRGIRLRSMNVGGVAMVQLSVDVTLNLEPVEQVPGAQRAVMLYPIVNSAKLKLAEFKSDNSSRFKGSTARALDYDTERIVKQQLAKHGKDLAESLNKQLSVDSYHIATNDLLKTKWGKMLASSTDFVSLKP